MELANVGARKWLRRSTSVLEQITKNTNATIGILIIFLAIFGAWVGPGLTPHDPTESNPGERFAGPAIIDSDNSQYLLGTDNYGRDLLTRTLAGGKISLMMGFSSIFLALLLGVPMGLFTGYKGGTVDEILMRFMDALISFPSLLLALLVLALLSSSMWNAAIAVAIAYFPRIARVVRSSTMSVKNEEYVLAAEARNESDFSIMFTEILPNILSPIIVEGTVRIGFALLVASTLSFLGLGAQPPTPDWGYMVSQGRMYTHETIWFLLWPGLVLGVTVMGFNLLGDGLRDILDPETNER